MGGGEPPPVPDWRIYKWQDVPELVRLQNRLGALGLKDPWARNEVWRYQEYQARKFTRLTLIFGSRGIIIGSLLGIACGYYVRKKEQRHEHDHGGH